MNGSSVKKISLNKLKMRVFFFEFKLKSVLVGYFDQVEI